MVGPVFYVDFARCVFLLGQALFAERIPQIDVLTYLHDPLHEVWRDERYAGGCAKHNVAGQDCRQFGSDA